MIKRYLRVINGLCKFSEIDISRNSKGEDEYLFDHESGWCDATMHDIEWINGCVDAIAFSRSLGNNSHYIINRISGSLVDTDYVSVWLATIKAIEEMENIILVNGDEIPDLVKNHLPKN